MHRYRTGFTMAIYISLPFYHSKVGTSIIFQEFGSVGNCHVGCILDLLLSKSDMNVMSPLVSRIRSAARMGGGLLNFSCIHFLEHQHGGNKQQNNNIPCDC